MLWLHVNTVRAVTIYIGLQYYGIITIVYGEAILCHVNLMYVILDYLRCKRDSSTSSLFRVATFHAISSSTNYNHFFSPHSELHVHSIIVTELSVRM